MSTALPRPPRRVSPETFYMHYLPSIWRAVLGDSDISWPSADVYLEISIDDAFYTLGVGPRGFAVTNAAQDKAHLRITCSREAWANSLALLWPQVLGLLESDLARARSYMQAVCYTATQGLMTALVKLAGTVFLHYTDDAGDMYIYQFTIDRAQSPAATVHLKDADCQRIAESDNIAAAVLQSKLQIDGDAGYVFALGQVIAAL